MQAWPNRPTRYCRWVTSQTSICRLCTAAPRLFAFPSLYEGFGLPVLEAMACGVPVMTSNITSLPEVAGDAALLVDPYSVESLATGLQSLLCDATLRRDLAAADAASPRIHLGSHGLRPPGKCSKRRHTIDPDTSACDTWHLNR